jgi:hypothetical protein
MHLIREWLKPCVASLGLLMAATAVGDEVVKTFEDRMFAGPVAKVLIVGAHPENSVRAQFENTVGRALRNLGVNSEPSVYRMSGGQELTADTLVAAARNANADAVLVTRVVDVQTHNREGTAGFSEYFQKYAAYEDPLPLATTHTVLVQSDLYLVEGQKRIWAVESTAVEKANLFGVIDGIADAVIAQLRADGLIE